MGDCPPFDRLLADRPDDPSEYLTTSTDGDEVPFAIWNGTKTEGKDIGYSSESQSDDEIEVMHNQIDIECKFPGKCEVASDGSLGDKDTLPSVVVRPEYYCMTLVDIDSTDKTDNGDTTDSGGEKVKECEIRCLAKSADVLKLDALKDFTDEDKLYQKLHKYSDSLEDSSDLVHFPTPVIFNGHFEKRKHGYKDTFELSIDDGDNGLTPMYEPLQFSNSDRVLESKEKNSVRYLIEHVEDLVKQPSPHKQHLNSPSKYTQTDRSSTIESSCDASGEDNYECDGYLKDGINKDELSSSTDGADGTLCNSVINLESASESTRHENFDHVVFSSPYYSQVYDSPHLRKQTYRNLKREGKDRPWSVVGLEDFSSSTKFGNNFHKISAASESAIDHLHFKTDTDLPLQFLMSSCSATSNNDNHSWNFNRALSSCNQTPVSKSAQRKLKYSGMHEVTSASATETTVSSLHLENINTSESSITTFTRPLLTTELPYSDISSRKFLCNNQHSRHLQCRPGLEKLERIHSTLSHCSTSDIYDNVQAASGSGTSDEYQTAPEELVTSDADDVHNVSGSVSENSAWDNYQVMYPTASEDPCEDLLTWECQDDLEFDDDFLLRDQKGFLVSNGMAWGQQFSMFKSTKQDSPCDDSDSDLDDFHHILEQSELALKMADQSLRKKRKNSMGTGLHLNPTKYNEIIMMYETNMDSLKSICQHLKSEKISEQDIKRVQDLMHQWEKLSALASDYYTQTKFLGAVTDFTAAAQTHIQEAEDCFPFDRFSSAEERKKAVILLEERKLNLEQQEQHLETIHKQLVEFSTLHPTICIDKYLQELTNAQKTQAFIINKLSDHLKQQTKWLEYFDRLDRLEMLLTEDRQRLHKLLCQQEYGLHVSKEDLMKELEILQSNLSLHESRLSVLQSMWAQLTKASDPSSQHLFLASLADLRNQLFVMLERHRQIYLNIEDDDGTPVDRQSDFGRLEMPTTALHEILQKPRNFLSRASSLVNLPISSNSDITQSCASWLHSLPVQVVALMLVTGVVCALDPDILDSLTSFTLKISPELRYFNGPPAT